MSVLQTSCVQSRRESDPFSQPLFALRVRKPTSASSGLSNTTDRVEQVSIPFTVKADDLPAFFRRRRKVMGVLSPQPQTMRELRNRTGLAPATLKRIVWELLHDGAVCRTTVGRMSRERVGYLLPRKARCG